jgi:membrane-associated PAP2 superfamily phosphatase
MLLVALGVWWPIGLLRRIDLGERLQLAVSALVALSVVSSLKSLSATSCPWDLAEFGGVARYASHWALGIVDGGGGRCFPAGHASAGFAFLGGYFALRRRQPRAARLWLAASLAAGLVLGGAQQVRGAHFMSHTLWTGWLCWTTGWLCDLAAGLLRQRFAFADSQLPPGPLPPATT